MYYLNYTSRLVIPNLKQIKYNNNTAADGRQPVNNNNFGNT